MVNLLPPIFYAKSYYEKERILKTKLKHLTQARKFIIMFQFIDDLYVINDGGEFEKVYHEN